MSSFRGAALPAIPESMSTGLRNQRLGRCSWVPGSALKGRPGTTAEFFRIPLRVTWRLFEHCDAAPAYLLGDRVGEQAHHPGQVDFDANRVVQHLDRPGDRLPHRRHVEVEAILVPAVVER